MPKCSNCGELLTLAERAKRTSFCDKCAAVAEDRPDVGPPAGICAFCCGGPLTLEHVFPRWLADLLPKNKRVAGVLADPMKDKVVRVSAGIAYDAQARAVCGKCNNGWMSDLEAGAMPLIRPMTRGVMAIPLQAEAQGLLARWAYKTALMVQYLQPEVLVPAAMYTRFYRDRNPGSLGFDFAQDHQVARSTMLNVWPTGLGRQLLPRNKLDAPALDNRLWHFTRGKSLIHYLFALFAVLVADRWFPW